MLKEHLKEKARELRQSQTEVEKYIWRHLRNRQLLQCKFRRQHVIGRYIVDFVCLEIFLVIELDGSQHFERQRYDNRRTYFLKSQGFSVLRFWNNDVMLRPRSVLECIYMEVEKRLNKCL